MMPFMPIGIGTTSDHSSDQGVATLTVFMSCKVLQVTPHIVGLIPFVLCKEYISNYRKWLRKLYLQHEQYQHER